MAVKIVGEIGINHNGDLEIVKKLIDLAAYSGFDYVKFQKREPDICVPEKQKKEIRETPWGKIKYIDYRKKVELSLQDYEYINSYCREKKIKWFASAWDIESAKFLTYFSHSMIKIPSAKVTDLELIKYCRDHFDYFILSTGMSNEDEILKAVEAGRPDVLMHSVSIYPTPYQETYMKYVHWLANKHLTKEIGYSGHELGVDLTLVAIAYGAQWIEKHITLDKNMWGGDQKMSIDPPEMFKLVRSIRKIEGAVKKGYSSRIVLDGELTKRDQLRGCK